MMLLRSKRIWPVLSSVTLVLLTTIACQSRVLPPLDLNDKPAILFFNNEEGCDCVLAIYRRADAQIAAWSAESRHGIPLHRIHLEQRPDLRMQYHIVRAPTLLLLDAAGNEVWRQDEVTSDWQVFDLETAERQIADLQPNSYED